MEVLVKSPIIKGTALSILQKGKDATAFATASSVPNCILIIY